jgi:hypothetical protein
MTAIARLVSIETAAAKAMTGIWEFAHPQAIAWGVGLAVLIAALSVEGIALWNATHPHH